jgi:hypothetical protein
MVWRSLSSSFDTEAHVLRVIVCQEFLSLILLQLRYFISLCTFHSFPYPGGTKAECRLAGEEAGPLGLSTVTVKADSHIACRAHAVPLPCRAAKGLECVFPI